MRREYIKRFSGQLNREMELLVFTGENGSGENGLHEGKSLQGGESRGDSVVVFPTSGGRFFEFEDRGMVATLAEKIERGQLQLFCIDSVDLESWYDRAVGGRARIERQMAYERYVLEEVVPMVREMAGGTPPIAAGCSFGGYHAANIALRHPEAFGGFVALSGIFDLSGFLDGYYDTDCYLNLPTHYLPRLTEARFFEAYNRCRFVLAAGSDDQCLSENQRLDRVMTEAGIDHEFYVWNGLRTHDWPTWKKMAEEYF